jgi:hypothetical protein
MNELSPDIVTFIIVPTQAIQTFGSLYEIKSEVDEVFISGATVDDLDIIDAITATKISASGTITENSISANTGIQSSSSSSTSSSSSSSSSSSGGSSY